MAANTFATDSENPYASIDAEESEPESSVTQAMLEPLSVLGLDKRLYDKLNTNELKSAFQKQVKIWHPDKIQNPAQKEAAHARFIAIKDARDTLLCLLKDQNTDSNQVDWEGLNQQWDRIFKKMQEWEETERLMRQERERYNQALDEKIAKGLETQRSLSLSVIKLRMARGIEVTPDLWEMAGISPSSQGFFASEQMEQEGHSGSASTIPHTELDNCEQDSEDLGLTTKTDYVR